MIRNLPSSTVQQLFEWAKESLNSNLETKFNRRLLRFGDAYVDLLRRYGSDEEEVDSLSEVLSQFLDSYQELYRAAVLQDAPPVYRIRIAQSLLYGIYVSIQEDTFRPAGQISSKFEELLILELETATSKPATQDILQELENIFIHARAAFEDIESATEIDLGVSWLLICHSLADRVMRCAIEHSSQDAMSAIFGLYEENLSTGALEREIRRKEASDRELAGELERRRGGLEKVERIRPLDLIGQLLRYENQDGKERQSLLSILENKFSNVSDIEGLADVLFSYDSTEDVSNLANNPVLPPITRLLSSDPNAATWRARAYVLESVRLFSPDTAKHSGNGIGLPTSPGLQAKYKRIIRAYEWLSIENAPSKLLDNIGEREFLARVFLLSKCHREAHQDTNSAARQSFLNSSIDPSQVTAYVRTQNENTNQEGLPALLRERNILITKSYDPDLDGVLVSQYLEPKKQFIDDDKISQLGLPPMLHQGPGAGAEIQTGFNGFLVKRSFRTHKYNSVSQLEQKIKSTVKSHRSSSPVIVESTMSDITPLEDERTFQMQNTDTELHYTSSWDSTPIIRAPLSNSDALVVYGSEPRVVEFHPQSGLFNIAVQTKKQADISPLFRDSVGELTQSKCLVSVRIRLGIRPGGPVGEAFRVQR